MTLAPSGRELPVRWLRAALPVSPYCDPPAASAAATALSLAGGLAGFALLPILPACGVSLHRQDPRNSRLALAIYRFK
eukprot:3444380-Pleurochrysis_carterae.AAC.4